MLNSPFTQNRKGGPMAVSMKDVRWILDPDEPNYQSAAELGPEAVDLLRDTGRRRRSDAREQSRICRQHARRRHGGRGRTGRIASTDVTVRVAAAASARNLSAAVAAAILGDLIADEDPGIRKVARRSAPG